MGGVNLNGLDLLVPVMGQPEFCGSCIPSPLLYLSWSLEASHELQSTLQGRRLHRFQSTLKGKGLNKVPVHIEGEGITQGHEHRVERITRIIFQSCLLWHLCLS